MIQTLECSQGYVSIFMKNGHQGADLHVGVPNFELIRALMAIKKDVKFEKDSLNTLVSIAFTKMS